MLRKITILLLSIWTALFLTSCEEHVKGSGVTKIAERNVPPFNILRVVGDFKVNVTSGQPQKISISADDNILPYIITKSRGQTLILDAKQGYLIQPSQTPLITITTPNLQSRYYW